MARRRREGRLLPAESDRLLRAARVWGLALELFEGDADAARRWLAAPSRALGGKPPLEVARTEIGAREVEQLVGRLEHGAIT
jgi:putative toxin-antitoxin system antitoxin component (TIGR02293 family)